MLTRFITLAAQQALFSRGKKQTRTREHTSASDVKTDVGESVLGIAFRQKIYDVRSACYVPKCVQLRTPENPFYHLELAKGLEPPTL
jgi:hypothetical protein